MSRYWQAMAIYDRHIGIPELHAFIGDGDEDLGRRLLAAIIRDELGEGPDE